MPDDRKRRTVAMLRAQRVAIGRHRPRRMPRQDEPILLWREYGAALAGLVSRQQFRAAFEELLRELPGLLAQARRERGDHTDAGEGKRLRALVTRARERLRGAVSTRAIEDLAEKFAQQTSTFQRKQLNKQTRAALGVDVFTGDRGLAAKIETFASENVALVTDITDQVAGRIEKLVTRALTSATLHEDLAKELESEFGFGEKRAKLIARDQVGKFYGQVNASRQKELGVNKFTWRTAGDQRVRGDPNGLYPKSESSHYDWDGEVFSYDDPPKDENGRPVLPGEPILCRCWSEPFFGDLLADVDAE